MSGRMLWENISIRIGRLSFHPLQCKGSSSNELRPSIEQKCRGRENLLFAWAGTSIFCPQIGRSGPWAFGLRVRFIPLGLQFSGHWTQTGTYTTPLVLRPSNLLWIIPPSFLVLLMADVDTFWLIELYKPIPIINFSLFLSGDID